MNMEIAYYIFFWFSSENRIYLYCAGQITVTHMMTNHTITQEHDNWNIIEQLEQKNAGSYVVQSISVIDLVHGRTSKSLLLISN